MIITGKKFSKPKMSRVKNGDIVLPEEKITEKRERLDHVLVKKFPQYNRSTLQNFIKSGFVSVDGKKITKPNAEIITEKNNQENKLTIGLKIPKKKKPADLTKLKIFEDDNVLVLNKPAGLLSMAKGEFTTEPTLEDYGLLVHRLDRDTSGVVILAKNAATQSMLRRQFQERKAHKIYYAIVEGKPKNEEALIDLPISRNLKRPTTFLVDPNGKTAQTYYKLIETKNGKSLLELKPITGRTHQLRVHLKYIGCPIVGDRLYNPTSKAKRLFLHAKSLEITIPDSPENARKVFSTSIPPDFKNELGK